MARSVRNTKQLFLPSIVTRQIAGSMILTGSWSASRMLSLLVVVTSVPTTSGRPLTGPSFYVAGTSGKDASGNWIVNATVTQTGGDLGDNRRVPTAWWWSYKLQFDRLLIDNRPSLQTKISLSAPPSPELSGYSLYEGFGLYKLYQTPMTWTKANETCEQDGAHLLVINSELEEAVIKSILDSFSVPLGDVFIGIHDLETEGKFETVLGDPLDSINYVNWADGQPNNLNGDQDCVNVDEDGKLNDWYCNNQQPFICEMVQ